MAFFEGGEYAHVVGDGAQIGCGFIHVGESVRRSAPNPARVGEHVHLIPLAEEHDAGRAGVQEADDAACLRIGPRAAANRARTASIVDLGRLAEGSFTGSETRRDTRQT